MEGKARSSSAMRHVFWLLGIGALAVALALLVGSNRALLTLFWPPYRVDVSFNFALFVLVAGFALLYLALRAFALLGGLPAQAQRWRAQQAERAAWGGVLDALSYQLSGRFVRAQAAGRKALDQIGQAAADGLPRRAQLRLLAHLLVAESAQSLRNTDARDEHLQAALREPLSREATDAHEGALLRAVHWAIEDRDPVAARARLTELPQGASRRIQAMRLRLRAARLDGATAEALDTARVLAKNRVFSPEAARSIVRGLVLDALRQAHDLSQLETLWNRLDPAERGMPDLALAAAHRANQFLPDASGDDRARPSEPGAAGGGDERLAIAQKVRTWMEPLWLRFAELEPAQQRSLVMVLEAGLPELDAAWLARLEQTQLRYPNNAYLQYLAGQAFLRRQLWGKSAQLLGQARHSLSDPTLLRRTWRALAALAEERGDPSAAQQAWQRAARID